MQKLKIWPYKQKVYAQIIVLENEIIWNFEIQID